MRRNFKLKTDNENQYYQRHIGPLPTQVNQKKHKRRKKKGAVMSNYNKEILINCIYNSTIVVFSFSFALHSTIELN